MSGEGESGATPSGERIQKVLSRAGVASRRGSERLMLAGRVQVNGEVVTELGRRVRPSDELRVDGQIVDIPTELTYVLLNKPPGFLSTRSDAHDRPIVLDLLPDQLRGLYPVGRLDWASEGLLLLTNDGDLAHRLMHPRFGVERVYAVKVKGKVTSSDGRLARLGKGVKLDDGETARAIAARVTGHTQKHTWLQLILAEGKNREVRRMCASLELEVLRLKRIAYGPLTVEGLRPGEWRELTPKELQRLRAAPRRQPKQHRRRKPKRR
jgi:pseudouridine synthase